MVIVMAGDGGKDEDWRTHVGFADDEDGEAFEEEVRRSLAELDGSLREMSGRIDDAFQPIESEKDEWGENTFMDAGKALFGDLKDDEE